MTIIYIAIGAFIGWNMPQPKWSKYIQQKIVNMITKQGDLQ